MTDRAEARHPGPSGAATMLLVVLLLLGAGLRLVAVAHTGLHAPGAPGGDVRHAAGLLVGGSVYLVLVRWQVWRWLAALAALPALLDVRVIAAESPPGGRYLAFAALSAIVVAAAWRGWDRTTRWIWAGAGVLLLGLALLLRTPGGRYRSVVLYDGLDHRLWWPVPVLGAALAIAAAVGLGRADASPLRGPCAALVAGPVLLAGLGPVPGVSWHDAPMLVVWGPAAGALGVTALLRGRRGRATARPQGDAVDEAALEGFHARYGHPQLAPVTVVIAAYNEAEGLPAVLATLPTRVGGLACDVVVVDDGSSDGTAEAVDAAAGAGVAMTGAPGTPASPDAPATPASRVRVVACPTNRGQGAALRLGYRIAREHGARYVLTTDADGQYAVDDFPAVLAPLVEDRADFVTGSRILGAQHTHDRVRRTGVHVFAWIATVLTGRRLTDTSFGLRGMRAEATAAITLNQPQYQSSELLLGMISHGYRVLEVPGTMHVRSVGASKKGRNLVYGSRYARVVLGTWWREGCLRPCVDPGLRTARTRRRTQEATGGRVGADAG